MKLVSIENRTNKFIIVDDEDYIKVNKYKWWDTGHGISGYVNSKMIILSRYLLNYNDYLDIDHKDRNYLNNQKSNLRICTDNQNLANRDKNKNNTSGYKGVDWDKFANKWRASIMHNGKYKNLGRFHSKKDAAEAYNKAALKYFKEFAFLNKIE